MKKGLKNIFCMIIMDGSHKTTVTSGPYTFQITDNTLFPEIKPKYIVVISKLQELIQIV
jgi:hypothetical protein